MAKMGKTPTGVSFSVKEENLSVLEQFNEIIEKGGLNRSAVFLKLMVDYMGNGKSNVEKMFDNYCSENYLSKDSQLMLLMGPYRVANGGLESFNKKEKDYPLLGEPNVN